MAFITFFKGAIDMKKILSLTLVILLLVSATCLVGCGGETPDGTTQGAATTATPKPDDTPAVKDEVAEALINKVGGASETFVGALSEETYASAEEAARAYVNEEVAGQQNAEILNTKSNGTLSDNQIKDAGIPDSLLAGADSVEELEVTYSLSNASVESGVTLLKSSTDSQKTVKVYVIKCGVNWQYFTPRPVTGDTISKTYYDSVFNAEKYKNCTFKATNITRSETKYSGMGESGSVVTETKIEQLIKFADNKIFVEVTTSSLDSEVSTEATVNNISLYLEEIDGEMSCYVKTKADGEWMVGSLAAIGFTSIDQLAPFHDQYLDYTYFTKTDYGFALGEESVTSYIDEVLGGEFSALLAQGMEFDMLAKYVVKDGVLSALLSDATLSLSMSEGGMTASIAYDITAEMTCIDYGTTVVEKPAIE